MSISSTFYVQIFLMYFVSTAFSSYILALAKKSYEKRTRETLMKSTPGLNFIKVLRTAFLLKDPKSVKRYWRLDWVLMLLGATGVKAVRKYVGEIEPWSLQPFCLSTMLGHFYYPLHLFVRTTLCYSLLWYYGCTWSRTVIPFCLTISIHLKIFRIIPS